MPHKDLILVDDLPTDQPDPDYRAEMSHADIWDATRLADRARIQASHLALRIARNAERLADVPAFEMNTDAHELSELVQEVAAQHAAVLAMLDTAIRQRDDALRGQGQWYDDMLDQIVTSQGCTKEEAWKLMLVLLNQDEQLMADDVVPSYDTLDQFRHELGKLIDGLNEDLIVEDE